MVGGIPSNQTKARVKETINLPSLFARCTGSDPARGNTRTGKKECERIMEYTNTKDENNIGIDVTSTFTEWVKGFPCDKKDVNYHGHFKITLTTESGSDSFDFYGSAFDAGKNKTEMTDDDLMSALECIISDALTGIYSFEEFCSEFGYDEDSRSAERMHKACEDTYNRIVAIGISEDEMYEIVNDINESE